MTAAGHVPVLARELVKVLSLAEGKVAIDCTFGSGGHAALVAEAIGGSGRLYAIDRDPVAESAFASFAAEAPCAATFLRGNFADALADLASSGVRAQAVYMDLGVSSTQIDSPERGFAYSYDAPLDMRMDPDAELCARKVVNEWPQERLRRILSEYGEERHAARVAAAIRRARSGGEIATTAELCAIVAGALPAPARFAHGHPAKRTFQAIRIAVNDELGSLERGLEAAWEILDPGGVLAAISFHSLEDRRVKEFMRERARGCTCPPEIAVCVCGRLPSADLVGGGRSGARAIFPDAAELEANPRSKSARLRAARKREGVA